MTPLPTATGAPSSVAVVDAASGSGLTVKVTELLYFVLSTTPVIPMAAWAAVASARAGSKWRNRGLMVGIRVGRG